MCSETFPLYGGDDAILSLDIRCQKNHFVDRENKLFTDVTYR